MMGLSAWKILIIVLLVVMLFGTKRLRHLGSDLGGAINGFRKSMREEEDTTQGDTPKRELK